MILNKQTTKTCIDGYFAGYPSFKYDQTKPLMAEFDRMCKKLGWDGEDISSKKQRKKQTAKERLMKVIEQQLDKDSSINEKGWMERQIMQSLQPGPADSGVAIYRMVSGPCCPPSSKS